MKLSCLNGDRTPVSKAADVISSAALCPFGAESFSQLRPRCTNVDCNVSRSVEKNSALSLPSAHPRELAARPGYLLPVDRFGGAASHLLKPVGSNSSTLSFLPITLYAPRVSPLISSACSHGHLVQYTSRRATQKTCLAQGYRWREKSYSEDGRKGEPTSTYVTCSCS